MESPAPNDVTRVLVGEAKNALHFVREPPTARPRAEFPVQKIHQRSINQSTNKNQKRGGSPCRFQVSRPLDAHTRSDEEWGTRLPEDAVPFSELVL